MDISQQVRDRGSSHEVWDVNPYLGIYRVHSRVSGSIYTVNLRDRSCMCEWRITHLDSPRACSHMFAAARHHLVNYENDQAFSKAIISHLS